MILELRGLEEFPALVTLEAAEGKTAPMREDVLSVGAVTVSLTVQKSGDEFFCQGTVTATVELECARCLGPFRYDAQGPTDFIATTAQLLEQYRAEAVDDEEYVIIDSNELTADISDIVRETLLLELPMKPVCGDECKGLCSQCGANRNTEPCDCESNQTDPRWEGLKGLLGGASEKGTE